MVSDDLYNSSNLSTIIAVTLTGTLRLADMPGNVRIVKGEAGITRDSVANVAALVTLYKSELSRRSGRVRPSTLANIDQGLKMVLGL